MGENKCEHLVRDGVCGASLDVCCVYQTTFSKSNIQLHSLRETFCNYPNVHFDNDYVKAIKDIARREVKHG